MNKSIVLVMCDILVLSAMSLSSGGFSETDELDVTKQQAFDFDVVSRDAYETLQQKIIEVERSASERLAKATEEAEVARANEARAKADVETARKNETAAKELAQEAQKRAEAAKAAEKAAREAESRARRRAEESAARESRAKEDAADARESEAVAKAESETARKNEAKAKELAQEAQEREKAAKTAEKAARKAEGLALRRAEESAVRESRAKADAETARTQASLAKAETITALESAEQASGKARELQSLLDEFHARQKALSGNIPQNISWKLDIACENKKRKKRTITLHSPLVGIDNECFLFFETSLIKLESLDAIKSIVATRGNMCITGQLYTVDSNAALSFVKVDGAASLPHIGFGTNSLGLEDNIVFKPSVISTVPQPLPRRAQP